MKRVSLIAVGLLAYGLTAARAEVGSAPAPAAPDATETTVTPPPGVDADGNPLPPSDVQVGVNPPATPPAPPTAGAPGSVQTAPAGSTAMPSGADVDVNPPAALPRPPVVVTPVPTTRPQQRQSVMPPAQVINNNTAAITGGVMEQALPVPQPVQQPQPPVQPVGEGFADHGVAHDNGHARPLSRVGAGFLLGGGYEDFTNSNLRSMTGGGGSWNARLLAGTRQILGVEAAYIGAARGIDALGVGSNAVLLSNGVEGNVRLNAPIMMRRGQLLEPFGFAGVGWSHYQVTNTNVNTSDLTGSDDVLNLPVGAGLEYAVGRFMADARFTYRTTYYNDLMRTGGSLTNWGVGGQLGFAF